MTDLQRDLAEAIERQSATDHVLEAIGRSAFELEPVFETVLRQALRLCRADGGQIYVLDGDAYRVALSLGGSDEYRAYLETVPLAPGPGTMVGRVGLERRTHQIHDVLDDRDYSLPRAQELGRWRTMLGVPMLAEDAVVGVITLWREAVDPFGDRTIGLVTTFAAQGAIAIQNVQLFQALQRRERQLEEAGRHKSEFLASMSHELRTPLNAVIGFSDVLLEQLFGELNEKQTDYIRDIRDSGRHLLELINEILDLSKVEAGRMELEPAALALPDLLEHALSFVRERAARGQVSVALAIAPEVGLVWADELKLKQVVINLLTNAVKFTEPGGTVEVSARLEGDEAQVVVRDTGIGIPEAEHERIFEAFQRGGRGPRSSTEGTGLGLTLSKRIVELHGGRIWMRSEAGVGSTFGFAIPVAPAVSTVLIVEDNERNLKLVRDVLAHAGFRTLEAPDAEQGLALAREHRPDAILMDIQLPGIDGVQALERLRADGETAGIPVAALTAFAMKADRERLLAAGFCDHLEKPIDVRALPERVRRVIDSA